MDSYIDYSIIRAKLNESYQKEYLLELKDNISQFSDGLTDLLNDINLLLLWLPIQIKINSKKLENSHNIRNKLNLKERIEYYDYKQKNCFKNRENITKVISELTNLINEVDNLLKTT